MSEQTMRCDFCHAQPVTARHLCDVRDALPWATHADRYWLACAECHALIVADNEKGLIERAAVIEEQEPWGSFESMKIDAKNRLDEFFHTDAGIWEPVET